LSLENLAAFPMMSRGCASELPMHIVHVHVHVSPNHVDAFKAATINNARASLNEPGCLRFDVVQSAEDPSRFILIEIYRAPADQAAHRETPHYATWRDTVAPMMAEPRAATKLVAVFPEQL
jgi:(4S)-4-hydroxy-5-phosphonooxypentane-2,3-dione isomerase